MKNETKFKPIYQPLSSDEDVQWVSGEYKKLLKSEEKEKKRELENILLREMKKIHLSEKKQELVLLKQQVEILEQDIRSYE